MATTAVGGGADSFKDSVGKWNKNKNDDSRKSMAAPYTNRTKTDDDGREDPAAPSSLRSISAHEKHRKVKDEEMDSSISSIKSLGALDRKSRHKSKSKSAKSPKTKSKSSKDKPVAPEEDLDGSNTSIKSLGALDRSKHKSKSSKSKSKSLKPSSSSSSSKKHKEGEGGEDLNASVESIKSLGALDKAKEKAKLKSKSSSSKKTSKSSRNTDDGDEQNGGGSMDLKTGEMELKSGDEGSVGSGGKKSYRRKYGDTDPRGGGDSASQKDAPLQGGSDHGSSRGRSSREENEEGGRSRSGSVKALRRKFSKDEESMDGGSNDGSLRESKLRNDGGDDIPKDGRQSIRAEEGEMELKDSSTKKKTKKPSVRRTKSKEDDSSSKESGSSRYRRSKDKSIKGDNESTKQELDDLPKVSSSGDDTSTVDTFGESEASLGSTHSLPSRRRLRDSLFGSSEDKNKPKRDDEKDDDDEELSEAAKAHLEKRRASRASKASSQKAKSQSVAGIVEKSNMQQRPKSKSTTGLLGDSPKKLSRSSTWGVSLRKSARFTELVDEDDAEDDGVEGRRRSNSTSALARLGGRSGGDEDDEELSESAKAHIEKRRLSREAKAASKASQKIKSNSVAGIVELKNSSKMQKEKSKSTSGAADDNASPTKPSRKSVLDRISMFTSPKKPSKPALDSTKDGGIPGAPDMTTDEQGRPRRRRSLENRISVFEKPPGGDKPPPEAGDKHDDSDTKLPRRRNSLENRMSVFQKPPAEPPVLESPKPRGRLQNRFSVFEKEKTSGGKGAAEGAESKEEPKTDNPDDVPRRRRRSLENRISMWEKDKSGGTDATGGGEGNADDPEQRPRRRFSLENRLEQDNKSSDKDAPDATVKDKETSAHDHSNNSKSLASQKASPKSNRKQLLADKGGKLSEETTPAPPVAQASPVGKRTSVLDRVQKFSKKSEPPPFLGFVSPRLLRKKGPKGDISARAADAHIKSPTPLREGLPVSSSRRNLMEGMQSSSRRLHLTMDGPPILSPAKQEGAPTSANGETTAPPPPNSPPLSSPPPPPPSDSTETSGKGKSRMSLVDRIKTFDTKSSATLSQDRPGIISPRLMKKKIIVSDTPSSSIPEGHGESMKNSLLGDGPRSSDDPPDSEKESTPVVSAPEVSAPKASTPEVPAESTAKDNPETPSAKEPPAATSSRGPPAKRGLLARKSSGPLNKMGNVTAASFGNVKHFKPPTFSKDHTDETLIEKALRRNFVFDDLNEKALKVFISAFEECRFSKGDTIIAEGEVGDYFYIIARGKVRYEVKGVIVATPDAGQFGELSLLYTSPHTSTVKADAPTTRLFRVDQKTFRFIMQKMTKKLVEEKLDLLKGVSFLQSLVDSDLNRLCEVMVPRPFLVGDRIVTKGDEGDAFYIVKEGQMNVTDISFGKTRYEDVTLGPGDHFGERALVTNEPAAANVVALSSGTLFSIGKATFEKVLGAFSRLILKSSDKFQLEGIKYFRDHELQATDYERLAGFITDRTLAKKDKVIEEDADTEAALYLVREGTVKITTKDFKRSDRLTAGGYFGQEHFIAEVGNTLDSSGTVTAEYSATVYSDDCVLGVLKLVDCRNVFDTTRKVGADTIFHQDQGFLDKRANVRKAIKDKVSLAGLERDSILGEGQFAEVWLVKTTEDLGEDAAYTNNCFAMKIQEKDNPTRTDCIETIQREISVLSQMDHPFIIDLFHTYEDDERIYMLTEAVSGGELWNVIHREDDEGEWHSGLTEDHAKFYGLIIADTVAYMHRKTIVFRDLKPENVLVDKGGYPIIVDFGFAKYCPDKTFTFCGTPNYVSPEIVMNRGHGFGADHWALGILIYEMTTGENPFYCDGMDNITMFQSIAQEEYYPLPETKSPELKNLLDGLLEKEPAERLGVLKGGEKDIITHKWFDGLDLVQLRARALEAPFIPPPKEE